MPIEGVIKFNYRCLKKESDFPDGLFLSVNTVREKLHKLDFIGQYPVGLCYGNISVRNTNTGSFFITASDTGKIEKMQKKDYVNIVSCDLKNNLCNYKGTYLPSSETLSHFVIYEKCTDVQSVIHIHHSELWHKLIGKVPTTNPDVEYGTVEMVKEIDCFLEGSRLQKDKILIMAGHPDGIIVFGGSPEEAFNKLLYWSSVF